MKRKLNGTRVVWVMIVLAMLGSMTTQLAVAQDDTKTCSLDTLDGKYTFTQTGFNIVNGVAVPKTVSEVMTFHGNGTVTFLATALIGGNKISDNTVSPGSYTVNSDCTGTLAVQSFPFPVFNLYVEPKGKSFEAIQVAPAGQMLAGTAHRISD